MARIECVMVKILSAITALNLKAVEKPCPKPGIIRHHYWSNGQDNCFQCRGSPAARVQTLVGAEVGDAYSPPKW